MQFGYQWVGDGRYALLRFGVSPARLGGLSSALDNWTVKLAGRLMYFLYHIVCKDKLPDTIGGAAGVRRPRRALGRSNVCRTTYPENNSRQ